MSMTSAQTKSQVTAENGGCSCARAFILHLVLMGIALAVSVFISVLVVRLCVVILAFFVLLADFFFLFWYRER